MNCLFKTLKLLIKDNPLETIEDVDDSEDND